jgi:hypothetical protein
LARSSYSYCQRRVHDAALSPLLTPAGKYRVYRAITGMRNASSGAFDRAAARMPNAAQRLLRGAELRKLIDVPRVSFESMMRKRARTALAMFSGRSAGVQRCAPLTRGV